MKKILALTLALTLSQAANADPVTSITIYGNSPQSWAMPYYQAQSQAGYAILTMARQVSFSEGVNEVEIADLPQGVDEGSIMVKSLAPYQQIIEQNFISSNLSLEEMLSRNIGKEVSVEQVTAKGVTGVRGTLLSTNGALMIKDGNKLNMMKEYSNVIIPAPESQGSSIKWLINSSKAVNSMFEYNFKTSGISWSASYNIYINGANADMMARIEGWANLYNLTNIDISQTNLKLVAGETAQADSGRPVAMMAMAKAGGAEMDMAASPAMEQAKFSDYHMYTIARKVSLAPQSSKRIKLFDDKNGVLAIRQFSYDAGISGDNSVKSVVKIKNDIKSRLGVPLPGGKYRIFVKDASGQYELAGEATAPHTAENETLELATGNSFDLKAERTQTDNEQDQLRRKGKYTVRVKLNSALDEEVAVAVKEPVYQQNWQILSANYEYRKLSGNQVEFNVKARPKSETLLEYIVEYSW